MRFDCLESRPYWWGLGLPGLVLILVFVPFEGFQNTHRGPGTHFQGKYPPPNMDGRPRYIPEAAIASGTLFHPGGSTVWKVGPF